MLGENIAITTAKPQTTRNTIKGIINRKNAQIIFIDTPGIHKPQNKFGKFLIQTAYEVINDVDIVLFVISATEKTIGQEEEMILQKLKDKNKKVILVINKIDVISKEKIMQLIKEYSSKYEFIAVVPISALKEKQIDILLEEIEKNLPEGPAYYNKEEYTDQTERQLVEEIVREKCLKLLQDEIPHGIYVKVEKMKKRKTKIGEPIYDIELIIYCIRESHKGIIIGKSGSMLKKIGGYSRQKIEAILGIKINMKIWVKVQEDWQEKESLFKN